MANGFHIDGDGNLWIGSTSNTFDNNAPFYVETDGTIQASSGTIGGLELASTYIQSSNYSSTNETGYRLQSDGNAQFYGTLLANDATISGTITASDGTIGGIDINTSDIQSNYSAANKTGFKIDNNGDAFFNSVDIRLPGTAGSGTPGTIDGEKRIDLGDSQMFEYADRLWISAEAVMIWDNDYTASATSPSLQLYGTYAQPGWYVDDSQVNRTKLNYTSGSAVAFHTESDRQGLFIDGAIYFGNDSGSAGEFIGKDSNGTIGWHSVSSGTTGINAGTGIAIDNTNDAISVVYGNTTNTSSRGDHDHDSSYLTNSHTSASNPHPVYVQALNHSHSNFLESADLSSYATNTALAAKLDATHSLNVYDHNAFLTSNNLPNNVLTNDNHTSHSGFLSVNHAVNSYDHSAFVTQNNIDFSNHNHSVPNHNHAYSSIGHGHSYASTNHNHNYAASDHTHSYAASSHNHAYASSFHNHSSISNHTHLYANLNHSHSGNQTINAWMHDDRFLSVNANSVPGLNVINRLNPVTANFNEGYVDRLVESNDDENYRNSFSSMKRKTFRITAQDVEQALADDGIDTNDVAWLIDRLYYVDPWLADEPAEKQAHGARGLMNGEFEAVLVQAVKDLSAKIDTLEDRIATLEG